jgi:hypothetical protein
MIFLIKNHSTGSSMMRDIRSSVGASKVYAAINDSEVSEKDYLYRDNKDKESESRYGMFCTGSYTYVWNYQNAMMNYRSGESTNDYLSIEVDGGESRPYGFARIADDGCVKFKNERDNKAKKIPSVASDMMVLLDGAESGDGTDLALYDFSVLTATRNQVTSKALFNISFVLGTTRGGVNVVSSSNYCQLNSNGGATAASQNMADVSMDYCSVNRFEFTVRQTGSKSGIGV